MAKRLDALGNQSSPSLPFGVNKSTRRNAAVRLPPVSARPFNPDPTRPLIPIYDLW